VRYVENIRSYYDILVWYTEKNEADAETPKPLLLDSLAL
jgi:membrane-bound lytic murein transglycosylase MltF